MTADYHQSLTVELASIESQIGAAEAVMLEVISLHDRRKMVELVAVLKLQRDELRARLDAMKSWG